MERYSDIFTKSVKIIDGTPNGNMNNSAPKVDVNKMTSAQLKEHILKNKDKLK
jgi:hypothetical protein